MDIYNDLAGVRTGPDGQTYVCAVGIAWMGADEGHIALKLTRIGGTSPLSVPAGAWVTQMAIAVPRPLLLGLPNAELKLAPRSNSDPDQVPVVLAASDESGLLGSGRYGCPFLEPGNPYRSPQEQTQYALYGVVSGRDGVSPAVVRAADGGAMAIAAAIWYSIPTMVWGMDEANYRSSQAYTPA